MTLSSYPWLFPADGQADNIRNGASGLLQVVDGKLGINSDIEGVPEAIAASINHQISTEEAKRVNLAEGITSLDEYPPEYVAWIREQALKLNGPDVAPSCAHAPGTPPPSILPFNDAAATEAAKKLCENKSYWDKMIVPQIAFGTGRSPDGTGKALGVSESVLIGDTEVVAGLYFMEGDCIGEFKFPPGPGDEQSRLSACINAFAAITDECDHDTKDQKYGGSLQDACAVGSIP
jgi:hypothetical protein